MLDSAALLFVALFVYGAGGGLASGLVVAGAGYPALALIGGIVALAVLPAIAFTHRSLPAAR